MSIFDFWAFEPNVWAGLDHGSLNDPHQATVNLANLTTQHKHKRHFNRQAAAMDKVASVNVFVASC